MSATFWNMRRKRRKLAEEKAKQKINRTEQQTETQEKKPKTNRKKTEGVSNDK